MWCIIIYSQTYNVSENSPPFIKRMTYACGAWLYSQTYYVNENSPPKSKICRRRGKRYVVTTHSLITFNETHRLKQRHDKQREM